MSGFVVVVRVVEFDVVGEQVDVERSDRLDGSPAERFAVLGTRRPKRCPVTLFDRIDEAPSRHALVSQSGCGDELVVPVDFSIR